MDLSLRTVAWVVALSLLASSPALGQQVIAPKAQPSEADISEAKKSMASGVALMQDPDGARYEEAYPLFKEAYRLSGSMNALQNLAICAMKLELDGEAIAYFKTVLEKKDGITPEDRDQIQRDITRLEGTLAWVTLEAESAAEVIDVRTPRRGAPVRNRYQLTEGPLRVGVRPGSHVFTATDASGNTATWKVEVANGSEVSHAFVFDGSQSASSAEPTAPGGGPVGEGDAGEGETSVPIPVWVVGGVTVAAGITFGALAGVASTKKSSYDDVFQQAPLEEQQAAYDELTTFNLAADVMLGVTAAGAATTLILALALPWSDEEAEASRARPRFGVDYVVGPSFGAGGVGLQASARF